MPRRALAIPLAALSVLAGLAAPSGAAHRAPGKGPHASEAAAAASPTGAPQPAAVGQAAAGSAAAPAPVLLIEAPRIDLGTVKEGADAVATFVLRNTCSAELRILAARPG